MKLAMLWAPLLLFCAAPTLSLPSAQEHTSQEPASPGHDTPGHTTPGQGTSENNQPLAVAQPLPQQQKGVVPYLDYAMGFAPWLTSAVLAVALVSQRGQSSKFIRILDQNALVMRENAEAIAANTQAMSEARGLITSLQQQVNLLTGELLKVSGDRDQLRDDLEKLKKKQARQLRMGRKSAQQDQLEAVLRQTDQKISSLRQRLGNMVDKVKTVALASPDENVEACTQEQINIERKKMTGEEVSRDLCSFFRFTPWREAGKLFPSLLRLFASFPYFAPPRK
jgi:hypothetical protein